MQLLNQSGVLPRTPWHMFQGYAAQLQAHGLLRLLLWPHLAGPGRPPYAGTSLAYRTMSQGGDGQTDVNHQSGP
jgi:hypothetical protein